MFNWRKNKKDNLREFPEPKQYPTMPKVNPPKNTYSFYKIGLTNDNRVSLTVEHPEIVMNKMGLQGSIDHLCFVRDQLID